MAMCAHRNSNAQLPLLEHHFHGDERSSQRQHAVWPIKQAQYNFMLVASHAGCLHGLGTSIKAQAIRATAGHGVFAGGASVGQYSLYVLP